MLIRLAPDRSSAVSARRRTRPRDGTPHLPAIQDRTPKELGKVVDLAEPVEDDGPGQGMMPPG